MAKFLDPKRIAKSQVKNVNTTYLKDYDYTMLKAWQFAHKSNDVLILDPEGKVLFSHNGAMNDAKIQELLSSIDNVVTKKQEPASKEQVPAKNPGKADKKHKPTGKK